MTLHLKINEQIAFPLDRPQLLLDSGYTFVYYVCPPPLTRGSLLRLAAAASFPVRCCSVATALSTLVRGNHYLSPVSSDGG